MRDRIKVLAFDADDTLWENETFFRASEAKFASLLSDYMSEDEVTKNLLGVEIANIPSLGYGVKSFVISMIDAAMEISKGDIDVEVIKAIVDIGKKQLAQPVNILEGVEHVLGQVQGRYRIVMATKGELFEQESKVKKSGLANYFEHIEVMSEKKTENYQKLMAKLDVKADEFLMIGNSIKSDILPVLELGGHALHIPYHTTWEYERVNKEVDHPNFIQKKQIQELLGLLE